MLTILKCLISNVDAMDIVYWSFIFLSLRYEVSAQYLEIQAKPTIVDPTQDDLVILCSTTAASDIEEVYTIQLKKNTSGTISYGVAVSSVEPVWFDTVLQTRATAIGSTNPPSAAYLKFTIPKANIHCPDDFTEYWCQMYMILNGTNSSTGSDHEDTNHISVSYKLEPTFMEKMRVRILGEVTDTANRKFAVGTALQLTCTGEVGSEPNNTIRWCFKTAYAFIFTPLPHVPVLSDASPSGCQYIRSSTVTYNMTNSDIFTQFLCESGTPGLCETGTAKQYLKITSAQPSLIETPRVRIVGEFSDTAQRQFSVGTAVQLTCTGQTGSDPRSTIRWCAKTASAFTFTGLPQTPIHSEASLSGCQYTRSSTITYTLTNSDTYTEFLCESGNSGLCETGTAKQYLNITVSPAAVTSSTPPPHQPVAFYARMASTTPLQHDHQTLIFSKVITNSGDNGRDGVFTAPLDGVYGFIWVTRSHAAEFHLMVNNDKIGSSRSSADSDGSISGNVIAHVNKDDMVFLRASTIGHVTGRVISDEHGASTFSGWIIR
ncbi:uncharacterized protein LOC125660939 [Ostrea edulis]|uniref:uncharacterized protein LOC125660939 n=1 Tax=Ostrea edulis TaxID=37623 RepID=UPI0024AFE717|nr:uncharacterized protein LOC125660939 [Ostrea edulis]